jgi:hypothetical protein
MAFFNYSTMQMTAKIVYYGPGLGGKTTNLEFIHKHTTDDSRGEMVSLQTQTDRTLFFDLLPMEVGTIAGFRTRIQLYTVPGQVFYNTTRKLVLKGVDGVVFVADSQRPMLQANRESLFNLDENLGTLGLSTTTMPLVLQYNKRDLDETCDVEELNDLLNDGNWPHFEASALFGDGVFETLQGITRLTLLALKKQLETSSGVHPRPFAPPPPTKPAPRAAPPTPEPEEAEAPAPAPSFDTVPIQVGPIESAPEVSLAPAIEGLEASLDDLAIEAPSGNGRPLDGARLEVELGLPEFTRSRRLLIDLRFHDEHDRIVHEVRDLAWDLSSRAELEGLLVRLAISARTED